MKKIRNIFKKPPAKQPDQTRLFLQLVQDHLDRVKQLKGKGVKQFVEEELENGFVLQQIVASAIEKLSLTRKEGKAHSHGFTIGDKSRHFVTVTTIPVPMQKAAEWYAHEFGGYISYLKKIENDAIMKTYNLKVFVHFIFGMQESAANTEMPWVICGLLPLWQKDFIMAILPTDCFTENERRELGL